LLFSTGDGNLKVHWLMPWSFDYNRHDLEKLHRITGLASPVCPGGRHRGRCHAWSRRRCLGRSRQWLPSCRPPAATEGPSGRGHAILL